MGTTLPSQVLTAADEKNHIDKRPFNIPFVCGAQDLGEALRRIAEGAAMIRLKGNAGTGNVMNAVRHARAVYAEIARVQTMRDDELFVYAKECVHPRPPRTRATCVASRGRPRALGLSAQRIARLCWIPPAQAASARRARAAGQGGGALARGHVRSGWSGHAS